MGFFQDLFTSPREREAPGLYGKQIQSYDDLLAAISGQESAVGDVGTIGDVTSKFGLKRRTARDVGEGVQRSYDPARRNLETKFARLRSHLGSRLPGSDATPGMTFGRLDSDYGQALGELESNVARQSFERGLDVERSDERYGADLLSQILGRRDQFGLAKRGLQLQGQGQKGNAIGGYLGALSGASSFDDVLALFDTAAKFVPFGGGGRGNPKEDERGYPYTG